MRELLRDVVVAPMAGGPTTPALVVEAGRAGAVGFLAAGYQRPETVEEQLRTVRAAGLPYGLNIFVPQADEPDPAAIERYRQVLLPEYERYQVEPPALRLRDDDHFAAKVELAVAYQVPLVSFTFGVPAPQTVRALRAAGCAVLVTVTSPREARQALAVDPDALVAQSGAAGGHASTTEPAGYRGDVESVELLSKIRALTGLPVLAAGGTADSAGVRRLLDAGAAAVQCGTALLLAEEAGTRPAQRAAMSAGTPRDTVVTRAFTGQPARALRNRFVDTYSAAAPIGYPAVHYLTAPIRAAAAQRGDAEALNLWAGTGYAAAQPGPVAQLLDNLRRDLPEAAR
jgi:nitronate monooxygenase